MRPIMHQWAQKLFTKQFLTKTTKHLDIAPGQLLMMQEVSEHSFDNDDDSIDDDGVRTEYLRNEYL